ncbi:phage tail protein [Haemophilus parainfluenzae]|uniref:phage tail protein n=1 Tax=Haemophilus parainfluenzae TaxID=729 RepID=UPI000FFF38F0|nr:phage tail protein [Haemophilus parainfluenzae]KAB1992182.1 phage tail protein [Haemophilus parainfluenzae]QAT95154.1 phage tail protein [Haemophilus parainfluenzae]
MGKITEQLQWEEDIYLIEKQDKVLGGELGVINTQAKQLANRTKYLKGQVDTINRDRTGYAPKISPAFTGIPTAPTAAASTNSAQIATTAFVKTAIAALVGSAPAALDTLEELARALAGDANLKATLLAEIGKKANATDFNALHDLFIGIPIPYPLSTVPTGCLAMNGQRFDKTHYPKLAQKYPSGRLPDLRGEFIRGWDNGRGVDAERGVLSAQLGSPIVQESHSVNNVVSMSGNNLKQIGFDESKLGETPNITVKMTTAEPANRANNWHAAPGTYSNLGVNIQYMGRTRPRNIAYHYICLAE